MDIHVFMDVRLQLSMLLWISIWISLDFCGYPCTDLLWILDPGLSEFFPRSHGILYFSDVELLAVTFTEIHHKKMAVLTILCN